MNDFSSVVVATDDGSMCVHHDVDDDLIQTLRRLLTSSYIFLERYAAECGEVDMPLCRIADDIACQADDFVRAVRSAYLRDFGKVL